SADYELSRSHDRRRSGNCCVWRRRHSRKMHISDASVRERAGRMSATTSFPAVKSKVFVVDDHPIVRQGLALLINQQPDLVVCGEAEEAHGALQGISRSKPDILIVDISLNGPDGLELLKSVRARNLQLPVLM